MVVPKREFPFEEVRRRPVKARKEDLQLIYEATIGKLKDGALASSRRGLRLRDEPGFARIDTSREVNPKRNEIRIGSSSGDLSRCYLCSTRISETVSCFHCTRACCVNCMRRCDGCEALFCSVCCTADYGQRDDRSFCFDCRNSASREAPLAQPPAIPFDHDVQTLPPSTRFRQSTLDYLLRGLTSIQRSKEDQSCGMETG